MKLLKTHSVFLFSLFSLCAAFGQITGNHIEIRVKNDDAGEISNWFNTGDDLGETQSFRLSAGLLKKDSTYNFRLEIESTEYSALNLLTTEPRDIFFSELNNFQISIDNNKFKNNSFFFSCSAGLYYIQSDKITIGATGQKYYWHQWIINKFYPNKEWIYVTSSVKDLYIPYIEVKYGYNKLLFKNARSSLYTINNLEGRIAGYFHYSGIGAKTYFDLKLNNSRFKMHSVDIELEGYYLTNITQYQIAFLQLGTRFNFKRFSAYTQVNKPIKKYLDNPFIKYNDMEVLFNYGLLFPF